MFCLPNRQVNTITGGNLLYGHVFRIIFSKYSRKQRLEEIVRYTVLYILHQLKHRHFYHHRFDFRHQKKKKMPLLSRALSPSHCCVTSRLVPKTNAEQQHVLDATTSSNSSGSPSREVSPKYVVAGKKYGRRSRPASGAFDDMSSSDTDADATAAAPASLNQQRILHKSSSTAQKVSENCNNHLFHVCLLHAIAQCNVTCQGQCLLNENKHGDWCEPWNSDMRQLLLDRYRERGVLTALRAFCNWAKTHVSERQQPQRHPVRTFNLVVN